MFGRDDVTQGNLLQVQTEPENHDIKFNVSKNMVTKTDDQCVAAGWDSLGLTGTRGMSDQGLNAWWRRSPLIHPPLEHLLSNLTW